eukprot:g48255.t1
MFWRQHRLPGKVQNLGANVKFCLSKDERSVVSQQHKELLMGAMPLFQQIEVKEATVQVLEEPDPRPHICALGPNELQVLECGLLLLVLPLQGQVHIRLTKTTCHMEATRTQDALACEIYRQTILNALPSDLMKLSGDSGHGRGLASGLETAVTAIAGQRRAAESLRSGEFGWRSGNVGDVGPEVLEVWCCRAMVGLGAPEGHCTANPFPTRGHGDDDLQLRPHLRGPWSFFEGWGSRCYRATFPPL